MGLSPLLVDTYRRYKRDTKTFTQWLGATARSTGLAEDVFEDGAEKQDTRNTGRKKGKNRKPRKQATAYKISVNAFAQLARAIKEAKASVVPHHIMNILGDVIKARKGCAAWYRAHQTEESETTKSHNEGHRHIIEALEEVRQILLPVKEKIKVLNEKAANENPQSTNLFGILEVEECPDWESEVSPQPTTRKKSLQDSYEPEASNEDVSFALYCFMKDMTEIRIFIRRTWREYKHGRITVNSAATTANTAMDVMRRLNEAFTENFPQFAEHTSLIEFLYSGYVDPNARGASTAGKGTFAGYEADGIRLSSKTFFCDHTTALVTDFYNSGILPMYQRQMMEGKGISDEEHVFMQCLSHLNMLDWQLNEPEYENNRGEVYMNDQVLRAVRTMRKDKEFPTWAILACQVFVDTQRELGSRLDQGYEDLKKQGLWMLQAWHDCLETGKDNTVNRFHILNDEGIRQTMEGLRIAVEGDLVQDIIEGSFEDHPGRSDRYTWGKHFLMKNHPLLCGLIVHKELVFGHRLGTRIAADQGPVRTAIHLNHAVSLAGFTPVGRAWADLDYIIEKHGDAYLFVGQRPTRLFDCFRHMGLSFGTSASQFSMNKKMNVDSRHLKRERDPPSFQKLHRRLLPMSRYVQAHDKLDAGAFRPTRAADDTFVMMELLVNRLITSKDISCPANPYNEKPIKRTRDMTPVQSLTIFKQALKEDDFALRFDLMSLNWRCVKLLRCIQKICIEQSPLDYPPKEWSGDHSLNGFIQHMFAGVAGVKREQPTRFAEACALVLDIIVKEGNAEYLQAEARMGIKRGTAVDPTDDPEDFEDPVQNFVPPRHRKNMSQYTADELSMFKSRGVEPSFP